MNALQLQELNDLPAEREGYRLDTVQQVTWALRKLAAINAKRAEIKAVADEEMHRIVTWAESENRKLDDGVSFFEGLLKDYAMRKRAEDPKFKSESTPYGAVKFRKQQPKWQYDDKKLLESLKSAGRTDLIRIKEEPNKEELKKVAAVKDGQVIDPESGAIIEGVEVHEQEDAVIVEVSV